MKKKIANQTKTAVCRSAGDMLRRVDRRDDQRQQRKTSAKWDAGKSWQICN